MSGPERGPISWDALAAELAATREEAEERGDVAPGAWDAVAAELAARVTERPREEVEAGPPGPYPPVLDPPVPERPAASETAPVESPPGETPQRDRAADPVEPLDPAVLRGGLEALLFVVDTPVDEETLAAALRCPPDQLRAGLAELARDYDDRRAGITLRQVGEGWRLYTREEHADVVERYLVDGSRSRLTQAALETLAVIAYRQPVTRARISAIRGVGVDGVMRTLLSRGLVAEAGSDPDTGGGLYVTTSLFLERLGVTSLEELPDLAPLLPEPSVVLGEHPDA